MEIYPALDLYKGRVVRLERGDYKKCKVYFENPLDAANLWVDEGAQWLHVVDLEGARTGKIQAWDVLEKILSLGRASVQFGGGVRQKDDIERLLHMGVQRVILGTRVLDRSFLKEVSVLFGERIALSFDLKGEEIQVEGWLKPGGISVSELFQDLGFYPVGCAIITDIERDGTLAGLNLQKIEWLLKEAPFPLIFSGGIRSSEDLRSLASLDKEKLKGVIIGRALYEGQVRLKEVLQ